MKKFDIIMLNMSNYSEWDEGVSNRNYHILKELSSRPEVGKILAVDYLPLTAKRAVRIFKEDLVLNLKNSKVIKKGLTYKVSKISEKLYVYSDTGFFWRPAATMKNIRRTALELNFGDLILWSYFPFAAPYWDVLGQKLTVFEAVDNWMLHSSYAKQTGRLQAAYDKIKNSADLIFVVSQNLLTFFDDQPNVYWLPNGVDFKHYNRKFPLVNRDIADIPKPIIGYIGVIQEKVDLELIKYLAQKNEKKSIVLVGPVWDEQNQLKEELEKMTNVHFLGYKTYQEAPMYIQQFDVGIIPHHSSGFSASTNPMKTYEYLACAKPVVATGNIGTENIGQLIEVAANYEQFDQKINEALKNDNVEKRLARQEFAKKYSWLNTVNKMMDLVDKKIN